MKRSTKITPKEARRLQRNVNRRLKRSNQGKKLTELTAEAKTNVVLIPQVAINMHSTKKTGKNTGMVTGKQMK